LRRGPRSEVSGPGFFGLVALAGFVLLAGCKKAAPAELLPAGMPEGTPVTLTEREKDPPALESMKPWYGWHMRGLQAKKAGETDVALYCFRQAVLAWPKEMPADVKSDPRRAALHRDIAGDSVLQLAQIFVERSDKKLALHFLDAWDAANKGPSPVSAEYRAKANALP
jgi:hypothetical protein